jgi:hypothetical protein
MPEELKVKNSLKSLKSRVKDFWVNYEPKIILVSALILVAVIAFEFGLMQGQKWQNKPLIIEKSAQAITCTPEGEKPAPGANLSPSEPLVNPAANKQACAYVGSKNSNKYHLPTCQWAKRIKPENVVCFKSVEDVAGKNYQPDKGCIK